MDWKVVPNFPRYEINADGLVRNIKTGHIMAPALVRRYHYVSLCTGITGRKQRMSRVHRLVWGAFRGPIPDGLSINHIDADRLNNRLENLELVTHQQNMDHAKRLGLIRSGDEHPSRLHPETRPRGENSYQAKLNDDVVRELREVAAKWPLNYERTARKLGVSATTIQRVLQGRTWRHVK